MKSVLVLAGGLDQVKLLQTLKERGFYVILIDYQKNPVAKPHSDIHEQVSTLDLKEVERCARRHQVSSIITACTDQALLTAAEVSEQLSLFFPHSAYKARLLTNKKLMKDHLDKNGLASSSYQVVSQFSDLIVNQNDFPLVIKPVDSNGSRGVFKVSNHKDLEDRFLQVMECSRGKQVIVERYMEGEEISIDSFVDSNGIAHLLLVSRSFKNGNGDDGFPISGSLYCPNFINYYATQILALLQRVAKSFSLTNTPLLVQAIIKDGDASIIELSARCGGGMKHRFIEVTSGFDMISATINSMLGIPTPVGDIRFSNCYWMMKYIYAEEGIIKTIKYKSSEKESEVWLTRSPGTVINGSNTSSDRVGAILFNGEDFLQLRYKLQHLYDEISLVNSEGYDMLRRSDLKILSQVQM